MGGGVCVCMWILVNLRTSVQMGGPPKDYGENI